MLQAMNTGHEGSLTTIHANSPRDALSRLETLVLTAGVDLPLRAIREQIASAFDLVVQVTRLVDGTRRVTHVTEVLRHGVRRDHAPGRCTRRAREARRPVGCSSSAHCGATGLRPHFEEKIAASGVSLPAELFAPDMASSLRAQGTRA